MKFIDADKSHALGIAEVHVQSWRETYPGIVPDDLLAKLSVEKRKEAWTTIICSKQRRQFTISAFDDDDRIVGFVNGGEPQEKELGYDSELSALYLLKSHQKRGIGKTLFRLLVAKLSELDASNMYLWALHESSTVGFYKHMNGEYVKSDTIVIGGKSLQKDLYLWRFK